MSETGASLRPLLAIAGVCGAMGASYGFLGGEPGTALALGLRFLPLLAAALWFEADARAQRMALVHDWGFLIYLIWPVYLPWYTVRTRGRRAGWRLALAVGAAICATTLGGIVGIIAAALLGRSA